MKFSKMSQLALVSVLGLLVATVLSGCMLVTIDYVFVACSSGSSAGSAGEIETFAADSQSGALRGVNQATPTGGSQPVSLAVSADYANLYVANAGNNTVAHFTIAANGELTAKESVTTPFVPASVTVNAAGTYLYVTGGSNPGQLAAYPLSSGAIGSAIATVSLILPGFSSDQIAPTAVATPANGSAVFVTAYDMNAYNPGGTISSSANPGWIYSFVVGSGGTLTAAAGSPYQAGVKPTSVTTDPTSRFVYATDYASNDLIGYGSDSTGVLSFIQAGPFKTGSEPSAVVVDQRGIYVYVANSLQATVSAYTITLPTGILSASLNTSGSATNATDAYPVAIIVDPALGRFVYTANNLGHSISGFRLNPDTGALTITQSTPYPTGLNPTALVAVPHGNHGYQVTQP